jgi:copper chaperone
MITIFRSQELSCPSCVAKIEKAVKSLKGVQKAEVFFNNGRIVVEHDPKSVSTDEIIASIRSVGYEAKVSAF